MQKITPFLWFDGKAEEASNFYTSIFKNSKIVSLNRWGEGSPFPKGQIMSATFELNGQQFYALDAGPQFKFTEALSFFVNCETQEEVDYFWEKLSAGGEKSRCGWLKDKYGLSWQVVPTILDELLRDKDAKKAGRVMQAMLQMDKIDIKILRQAYEQKQSAQASTRALSYQQPTGAVKSLGKEKIIMAKSMKFEIVSLPATYVAGLAFRTKNDLEQNPAAGWIAKTWGSLRTMKNPNPPAAVYTDYESDYHGYFTGVVGFTRNSANEFSPGEVLAKVPAGRYAKFVNTGKLPEVVIAA